MAKQAKSTAIEQTYDGSTPLKNLMQEMFVANLLRGMNQSEAYRQAGYKAKNPEVNAIIALRNTNVASRLAFKRGQLAKKMDITAERVVLERARIAFADPAEMYGANGVMLPIQEMPEDIRRAIASVDMVELFTGSGEDRKQKSSYRLWNKNDALESLEKQLGLFEKDNAQKNQSIFDILALVGICVDVDSLASPTEAR